MVHYCLRSMTHEYVSSKTHSLTAAHDQLRVVLTALTDPWLRSTLRCTGWPRSSSTWLSHVRCGRPGGRLQFGAGRIPLEASIQSCRAWCAGASDDSRQVWSNKEWRRSAIISGRSLRPVFSLTAVFLTWSNHFMPKIRRCDVKLKAWTFSPSTFLTAQVSDPYRNTDRTN